MKLDETVLRASLHLASAGFLLLDGSGAARSTPQVGRSARDAIASLYRALMKFWISLYAPVPRRLRPMA